MPKSGARILSDFEGNLEALTFVCSKCDRRGRYHLATLIERFGDAATVPNVLAEISADCPRRSPKRQSALDLCGVHVLELIPPKEPAS